jgi:hypothetical protein
MYGRQGAAAMQYPGLRAERRILDGRLLRRLGGGGGQSGTVARGAGRRHLHDVPPVTCNAAR